MEGPVFDSFASIGLAVLFSWFAWKSARSNRKALFALQAFMVLVAGVALSVNLFELRYPDCATGAAALETSDA